MSLIHNFHIPVMGLGFTVDTPLKVARFGISSVVSIMDDQLLEDMRSHYTNAEEFEPINEKVDDSRAKRIKAYLNFLQSTVDAQVEELKNQNFGEGQ